MLRSFDWKRNTSDMCMEYLNPFQIGVAETSGLQWDKYTLQMHFHFNALSALDLAHAWDQLKQVPQAFDAVEVLITFLHPLLLLLLPLPGLEKEGRERGEEEMWRGAECWARTAFGRGRIWHAASGVRILGLPWLAKSDIAVNIIYTTIPCMPK